jgi:hypothetical protein
MEKKMYFEVPTQVVYCDADNCWYSGIAYRDEIICACCGGVVEIAEVYEFAPEGVTNPIEELEWVNVREEIGGDRLYEMEEENA